MTLPGCRTLVLLCLSLVLTRGLAAPAAKRLPLAHDTDDVIAGSDFLSVFMHRRTPGLAPGPFEPHHLHLNSVTHSHHGELVDLVKPHSKKYTFSNIFKSAKYGYAVNDRTADVDEFQVTTPDIEPTLETDVKTTTLFTEATTIEDAATTIDLPSERSNQIKLDSPQLANTYTNEIVSTETPSENVVTEKVEEKVISVRVSSSVARHSHRTKDVISSHPPIVEPRARLVDENLVSTLVTQEQPTLTAVQRSEFAVEESAPASETAGLQESKEQNQEEVAGKVQEVSVYRNEPQRRGNEKLPVFEIHFPRPHTATVQDYGAKSQEESPRGPPRRKEFRQLSPYGTPPEPSGYHSHVSYRETSAAETMHQPVVVEAEYHQEPVERVYGEPERVYGQPEVNYEVDEAVSVMTNGKAHGPQPQGPTAPPQPESEQNKFGYVVEGRNFRKYRVEERTADGFIVGEYGVVSHDDGSLRGVRYTADSNINPRLIYDALVKFLSLK